VRNLRDVAGFTKVRLAPGQSAEVKVAVRLVDLSRYDPEALWTNRKGATVVGAYVITSATCGYSHI
jgi:GH25 family lysozyme M1 (1,4-beta-N-acetylmuramidase)